MKILALEFSSAQRGVAIGQQASPGAAWMEYEAVETGAAATRPFELIEDVLKRAALEREQVETLAIGLGPGSYTGIRAAIALAQGWELGREVKLIGVSSAECVAAQAQADGLYGTAAVVIDAQRGEFYLANYEISSRERREIKPLRLASRATVIECQGHGQMLIGPDLTRWFEGGRIVWPRAAILARLAAAQKCFIRGENLEPIYLRQTTFVKAPPARELPK